MGEVCFVDLLSEVLLGRIAWADWGKEARFKILMGIALIVVSRKSGEELVGRETDSRSKILEKFPSVTGVSGPAGVVCSHLQGVWGDTLAMLSDSFDGWFCSRVLDVMEESACSLAKSPSFRDLVPREDFGESGGLLLPGVEQRERLVGVELDGMVNNWVNTRHQGK